MCMYRDYKAKIPDFKGWKIYNKYLQNQITQLQEYKKFHVACNSIICNVDYVTYN